MEGETRPAEPEEKEDHRGTVILTFAFLGLIIVLWLWTYFTLLGRG